MEYCEAGSVSDMMAVCRVVFEEPEIATILHSALLGLDYLHKQRKIHRDIKAANILLNGKGESKLADFGVSAQLSETITKRRTMIGTPYWMAPEVLTQASYDTKADIWSLGITAIEIACGAPPLNRIHPMRALVLIPSRPPPTLPNPGDFSENFNDFIAKCLTKDPSKRPSAEELLNHPFIKGSPTILPVNEFAQECIIRLDDYRKRLTDGTIKNAKDLQSGGSTEYITIKTMRRIDGTEVFTTPGTSRSSVTSSSTGQYATRLIIGTTELEGTMKLIPELNVEESNPVSELMEEPTSPEIQMILKTMTKNVVGVEDEKDEEQMIRRLSRSMSDLAVHSGSKNTNACKECKSTFNVFRHRHRCHACLGEMCFNCSEAQVDSRGKSSRCCKTCYRLGVKDEKY